MLTALAIVALIPTPMQNVYELSWKDAEPAAVIEAQCHKNQLHYTTAGVALGVVGKMYVGMRLENGESLYCKIRTYSPPAGEQCPISYGEFTPFARYTFTGIRVPLKGGAL